MFSSVVVGGTIADRIGSRSAYRNEMLLFVAASVVCAFSLAAAVGAQRRKYESSGSASLSRRRAGMPAALIAQAHSAGGNVAWAWFQVLPPHIGHRSGGLLQQAP
jgi:hypothetical protein